MEKPRKGILLDIMMNGRFYCQLNYKEHGRPVIQNGVIKEEYDSIDLQKFVEQQRPSLIGKKYIISFSTQKVL